MRTNQRRLIVFTLGFVALSDGGRECCSWLLTPQIFVVIVSQIMVEKVCYVRCIFVYVYFPHLLGGFLHILTCTCNYMLWPLALREYNLSIPNMVSEQ
jgi:hypothetical protein